jgi:hypothetical protein
MVGSRGGDKRAWGAGGVRGRYIGSWQVIWRARLWC